MKKAIFGLGGHSKELKSQIDEIECFFVDDDYFNYQKKTLPISKFDPNEYELMIAVADCFIRQKIIKKLPKETKYFNFIHPTAQIFGKNIKIGIGNFIGANCILTDEIILGNHCILNRSNQIGHDCKIGNYFSSMPGAVVSGSCCIGNCVYLGTNSSIKEKIKICDNVIIGLNSGVVKDIKKSGIYGGVPAKRIK